MHRSLSFARLSETQEGGEKTIRSEGKGLVRAANLTPSGVSPMNIVGLCDIPLVFMPEDRVRRMAVRVAEGLPYGLTLGAAFLRQSGASLISQKGRLPAGPSVAVGNPREIKNPIQQHWRQGGYRAIAFAPWYCRQWRTSLKDWQSPLQSQGEVESRGSTMVAYSETCA